MALIEGIGDEVIIWTSVLSIFIILLIWSVCSAENFGEGFSFLWPSEDPYATNNEVPTQVSNHAVHNSQNVSTTPRETSSQSTCNSAAPSADLNEPTLVTDEETAEKPGSVSENGTVLNSDTKTSPSKSGKDFLRKRRLEFYLRPPGTDAESLNEDENNAQSTRTEALEEEEESQSEEESEPIPTDTLQVRLKYLNDTESLVRSNKDEKLGEFRRRYFSEDLANDRTVRLIFNGQLLSNEEQTIGGYGIKDNSVVHVQISQNPPQQRPVPRESDSDLELYMWPLFVIILIFFWMLYFQYKELFNPTSTVTLVILTVLLFIAIWGHAGPQSQRRQT